jgi:hypothetical protein
MAVLYEQGEIHTEQVVNMNFLFLHNFVLKVVMGVKGKDCR